jgi:hypothetical protein
MTEQTLHYAMVNSFNIIILGYDWEEIIDGRYPYFAHNIAKRVPNKKEINNILKYFIEVEDYEKCIAIKTYIKEQG